MIERDEKWEWENKECITVKIKNINKMRGQKEGVINKIIE